MSYQSLDATTQLTPGVKKMTPDSIDERQKFLQGHGGRRRDGYKPMPLDTDDTSTIQVCDVSGPEQVVFATYHVQQSLQLTISEPYQLGVGQLWNVRQRMN